MMGPRMLCRILPNLAFTTTLANPMRILKPSSRIHWAKHCGNHAKPTTDRAKNHFNLQMYGKTKIC